MILQFMTSSRAMLKMCHADTEKQVLSILTKNVHRMKLNACTSIFDMTPELSLFRE